MIPLGDVKAKVGATSELHKVSVVAKSGVISGVIVTAKVVAEEHCPAFGVKI